MASIRSMTALAVLALAGSVQATNYEFPPCLDEFQPYVYSGCFQDSHPNALTFRSTLDTQDMTVEKCVAHCKGNGYRYAGLEYYGECFCGMTVNAPQIDEENCSYPCTGNNTQTCGGSDIISVWTDPTFPVTEHITIDAYEPIGCWTDDSDAGRALPWPMDSISSGEMTTDACLTACRENGYPFAGTEFGGECWCGVVVGNNTVQVSDGECDMPCNGDSSEICGGRGRLTMYIAEELESLEPCGYEPPTSPSPSTSTPSSTATSPSSTTTPPTTTTRPSSTTTTTPTTTKTTSLCPVTYTPQPECQYKCGRWCANNLPEWNDDTGCRRGSSSCSMQVAACFKNAGFPASLECFEFGAWCLAIEGYCNSNCKAGVRGKTCGKSDCLKGRPPKGPTPPRPSTSWVPCPPATSTRASSTTTTKTSTTTSCVPTPTNICKQPTNSKHGYKPGNPVGGIELPVVTCNDLRDDFRNRPFKLYTDSDSRRCKSYGRGDCNNACKDACREQYDDCVDVYAEGCRSWHKKRDMTYFELNTSPNKRWLIQFNDTWERAKDKCRKQYDDCLDQNKNVNVDNKCKNYDQCCR